jgi:hypothetical protein
MAFTSETISIPPAPTIRSAWTGGPHDCARAGCGVVGAGPLSGHSVGYGNGPRYSAASWPRRGWLAPQVRPPAGFRCSCQQNTTTEIPAKISQDCSGGKPHKWLPFNWLRESRIYVSGSAKVSGIRRELAEVYSRSGRAGSGFAAILDRLDDQVGVVLAPSAPRACRAFFTHKPCFRSGNTLPVKFVANL